METRSKIKSVPQGILTTSFVKEVSKTLPTIQGTYPALQRQQLVKNFPNPSFLYHPKLLNSMFPLKNLNILFLPIIQLLQNLQNLNLLQVLKPMI
jgi:hypothetical protein